MVAGSTKDSISLTWQRPTLPNGLIMQYSVNAVPANTVGLTTPISSPVSGELNINVCLNTHSVMFDCLKCYSVVFKEPEMPLNITITGLQPATNYSITLTAATSAGSATGPPTHTLTGEDGMNSSIHNASFFDLLLPCLYQFQ